MLNTVIDYIYGFFTIECVYFFKDLFPDEDTTYQVFVSGAVIYGTPENSTANKEKRLFSHIFILTVDVSTSTWVVSNECFRFHE